MLTSEGALQDTVACATSSFAFACPIGDVVGFSLPPTRSPSLRMEVHLLLTAQRKEDEASEYA